MFAALEACRPSASGKVWLTTARSLLSSADRSQVSSAKVIGDEHLARPGSRHWRLLIDQLLWSAADMRPQRHHRAHP